MDELPKGIQEATRLNDGSQELLLEGLFALQELPRCAAGWKTEDLHGWEVLSYQSEEQWRGEGIMYNPKVWAVMRRREFERGIWVRVRHLLTQAELWVGCIHCTQRCAQVTHAQEINQALRGLSPTRLPTLLMGDVNANIGWGRDARDLFPFGKDGKGLRMLDLMKSRSLSSLRVHTPREEQRHLPTSRQESRTSLGTAVTLLARIMTSFILW